MDFNTEHCMCSFPECTHYQKLSYPPIMLCNSCQEQYWKWFYKMSYDIQSSEEYWCDIDGVRVKYTRKQYEQHLAKDKQLQLAKEQAAKANKLLKKRSQALSKRRLAKFLQRNSHYNKIHPGNGAVPTKVCTQSAEVSSAELQHLSGGEANVQEQATVMFSDQNVGQEVGLQTQYDEVSSLGQTTASDIKEYLSRPCAIYSTTWLETDAKGYKATAIKPWSLFFNNTSIKRKLDNYSFLRCNLKLKIVTNASPFLYGLSWLAYIPLPGLTPSTIINDTFNGYFTNISQREGLWITPQCQEGGEMTLPFFYHKNYLAATSLTDLDNMGQLDLVIYAPLQSANGVTTSGVTITIYAWAEDVELVGPTAMVSLQSKDSEWGEGVISKPASAIASIARNLYDVPFIGPFARATDIGASAVSSIASLFGFTNLPVLDEDVPVHPTPFPGLASVDRGYPVKQLTLCSKNELTLDPRTVGLSNKDELAITNLATKESWIADFAWSSTNSSGDNLFTTLVTPAMFNYASGTYSDTIQMTPICWVSKLFASWRGDIIFRFRVVCSPFHKGRLKISYDPAGSASANILSSTDYTTSVYTRIVDIGKDTDIEIRVPYTQATSWLKTPGNISTSTVPYTTSLTPTFSRDANFDNGYLNVKVLNILTGPLATASVSVQVFVRAAENFELANPAPLPSYSNFAVQSGEVSFDMGQNTKVDPDKKYLVNFGESIGSLRSLMRRSAYSIRQFIPIGATSGVTSLRYNQTRFPPFYGYDPNGWFDYKKITTGSGSARFNTTDVTPYHWVAPAFVGQRGSMIWHYNICGAQPVNNVRYTRTPTTAITAGIQISNTTPTTIASGVDWLWNNTTSGTQGTALQDQRTNAGFSVQIPNYTNYRFQTTNPAAATKPATSGQAYDGGAYDGGRLDLIFNEAAGSSSGLMINTYTAIGPDFTLLYFLNVPSFIKYNGTPLPN